MSKLIHKTLNCFLCSYLLVVLFFASTTGFAKEIYREKSLYRDVRVTEDSEGRCMRFGRYPRMNQTCISINAPQKLIFNYTKAALASLYLNPQPSRVLVIGLGGGIIPTVLQTTFPGIHIDVVEIDSAVVKVAAQYFNFKPSIRTSIFTDDGRYFVKKALRANVRYDLIYLDAFDENYIPEHLLTVEFLREVRSLLTANGVIASNTFTTSKLKDSESATYFAALGGFATVEFTNRVILFRNSGLPSAEELEFNANAIENKLNIYGVGKKLLLPKYSNEQKWDRSAKIFTDQYSPANLLNNQQLHSNQSFLNP